MKKRIGALLALLLTLSSCAGRTAAAPSTTTDAETAAAEQTQSAADGTTVRTAPNADLSGREAAIDLTALDTQMAYIQLSNMMISPEDYVGQTVKMRGTFAHTVEGDKEFFVCYLMDATACCSQSLEFETDEAYSFPEGYPPAQSEITVFGVFDTYEFKGYPMFRLLHAELMY